jgi:HSP20 family protein
MATRIVPEELVEFDSPFAEFFRDLSYPWSFFPVRPLQALTPWKQFVPAVDVFKRGGDLVVKLDLPGIDPKDVKVKLDEGLLTVTGERKADSEIKEEGYYRRESSYGLFERRMAVPKGITEAQIKAEYDNGVLMITMPGATKIEGHPKAKEIPIKQVTKQIKA